MTDALINLSIPIGLILLGLVTGKCIELSHLRRLDRDEQELKDIRICNLRNIPADLHASETFLVFGGVVIATDYFKVFAAGLRNLFGGELKTYRSLMARARREAIVRMLYEAKEHNADSVWNIRFETSTIQGKRRRTGGIEVLVYGTAVKSS
ncbi:MAG: YbjQ family protein [Candidatus Brocadiia bacterium]|nr:MAG: YbjQ family protein [Candidatus Brocadiia bacterium]